MVGAWYDSGSESSRIPLLSSSESRRGRSAAVYDSLRSGVRMTSLPCERGMEMSSVLMVLFSCTPSSLKCEFQSEEKELKGVEWPVVLRPTGLMATGRPSVSSSSSSSSAIVGRFSRVRTKRRAL